MAIRQATIAKYHNFLKDLVDKADNNMIIHDFHLHISKHQLNNAVSGELQRLGYMIKVLGSPGSYEIKLVKPEPKHARILLENLNFIRAKSKLEKSKSPEKNVVKTKRVKKQQISENSKKEFTMLWGLISLKW
jgi:hypothetical protein